MYNYVISLNSAFKRRNHIISEFGRQNISFEFFDALTPQVAISLANNMGLIIQNNFMTDSEVACFMSHVSIWDKMINENISHVAIFEDDVILGEDVNQFLSSSDWFRNDWNIVKIEKFNKRVVLSNVDAESPSPERKLKKLLSKHYGCAGYILSLNAAKELIAYLEKNPTLIPLDHIVFEHFMSVSKGKILQLNPAICIQDSVLQGSHDNFPSDLELERRKRMKENKKKGLAKVLGEFSRVIQQLKLKLFGSDIGFK
ncbi:glycosyltransferase family 25 protein [Acinetobacter faecalis]|uniref:Glycosyltransferase family 25 protein n=1 Tax=Acinetobacter faecalis TaxID=2665161 RepID=A0ABU5GH56_9GAMM|nr:glycosyltransferase family 25 protein [Acinetobacter faecalis]MDY6549758.1 glycosyltransferase family 25 protein [Acinetobacter faecalis]